MKILVYSDLQADTGNERLFSDPTKSLRLWCVSKLYRDLENVYREHRCDALFDLGDTFDDRTAIDIPTIDTVITSLEWLPDNQEHTRLIGNHDQYQRNGSIHNGKLLAQYFKTIDDRRIQVMGDWTAFFVSYPADHAELTAWLIKEARRIRAPKILFGHFQVEGSYFQSGQALTGIPQEALKEFSLVLLGHIHLPQAVTPKIHYVGSPFQQDWGEVGQSKRVGIVNTNDLSVTWVPLTGYPEYRSISLKDFTSDSAFEGEHRYRVTLNSHEEAEQFFRHPHFNRAIAQYNYDETPPDPSAETNDWSFKGTCRRYLKMVPPAKVGIEMTDEEMLDVTQHII